MLDCRKTINRRLLYVSALSPWMYTSLMVEHHDLNPSLKFWTQLYIRESPPPPGKTVTNLAGTTARADSLTLMHPPKLHGTHRRHSTPRLTLSRDRSVYVRRTPKTLTKKRRAEAGVAGEANWRQRRRLRCPWCATLSYQKIENSTPLSSTKTTRSVFAACTARARSARKSLNTCAVKRASTKNLEHRHIHAWSGPYVLLGRTSPPIHYFIL